MPERTALYRLYDTKGQLLYVGITSCPKTRWQTHAREKPWWPKVSRKTIEWFETRKSATRVERIEIQEEQPKYNVAHNTAWARHLLGKQKARKRFAGTVVAETPRKAAAVKPRRLPPGWTRHSGFHPEHPNNW